MVWTKEIPGGQILPLQHARCCLGLCLVFSLSATPVKWRVAEDCGMTVAPLAGMGALVGYSVNVFHSTDFLYRIN
jgi:hypothetical protein